jgi:hypothetical protein
MLRSTFDQLTFDCITKASIGLGDDSFENVLRDSLPELVGVEDFAPLYSADAGADTVRFGCSRYCCCRRTTMSWTEMQFVVLDVIWAGDTRCVWRQRERHHLVRRFSGFEAGWLRRSARTSSTSEC